MRRLAQRRGFPNGIRTPEFTLAPRPARDFTMPLELSSRPGSDRWRVGFSEMLAERRGRLRKFTRDFRQRVDTLETELQDEWDDLHARAEEARSLEAAHRDRFADLESRLETGQADWEQSLARARDLETRLAQADHRVIDAELKIEELRHSLEEAESQSGIEEIRRTDSAEFAKLHGRLATLQQELRDWKRRHAELERQLPPAGGAPAAASSNGMDWEAQKRRLLAALEADDEATIDEERKSERLKIQDVIRQTDRLISERNEELAELREVLEQQTSSIGSVAVGAAAFGEMFGKDEIIQQERERLAFLENEWQEKLRAAEVEISLERANLARERARLEEWRRAKDEQPGSDRDTEGRSSDGKKPQKGWRAMLGLQADA